MLILGLVAVEEGLHDPVDVLGHRVETAFTQDVALAAQLGRIGEVAAVAGALKEDAHLEDSSATRICKQCCTWKKSELSTL